ncbi:MAG TPA: hypothetical protein VII66_09810 [Gemmatimonadaceae bacterium]
MRGLGRDRRTGSTIGGAVASTGKTGGRALEVTPPGANVEVEVEPDVLSTPLVVAVSLTTRPSSL